MEQAILQTILMLQTLILNMEKISTKLLVLIAEKHLQIYRGHISQDL